MQSPYGNKHVIVVAEDFLHDDENPSLMKLFGGLKEKMMRKKMIGFSTNFSLVDSIEHNFQYPFDVKISYYYNCILVTDYHNSKLQTFNLQTKLHISDFSIRFPRCCTVERREKTDFLIVSCVNSGIYKYDIKGVLDGGSSESKEVWVNRKQCNWPNGLDVSYQLPQNLIYVCDTDQHCIRILNSVDGLIIKSIYTSALLNINLPWSICVGKDTIMFSNHYNHSITVVKKQDFTKLYELQDETCGGFQLPCGIIIDEESEHVIASSSQDQTIQIFNKQGMLFKHFKITNDETEILGIALNHWNGELFVVSSDQHKIMIFK